MSARLARGVATLLLFVVASLRLLVRAPGSVPLQVGPVLSPPSLPANSTDDAPISRAGDERQLAEAKHPKLGVELSPLGRAFPIGRVLANLGPATTNEVTFHLVLTVG